MACSSNALPLPNMAVVPEPRCREDGYDTYEKRLATYHDWPPNIPVKPCDLARAGFYYTHFRDKVRCPYCYVKLYNWEPTDNPFGEHARHFPHCKYLKYYTYQALSTPVPPIAPRCQYVQSFKDLPPVRAVELLGYHVDIIRDACARCGYTFIANCNSNNCPSTDRILDEILKLERIIRGFRKCESGGISPGHAIGPHSTRRYAWCRDSYFANRNRPSLAADHALKHRSCQTDVSMSLSQHAPSPHLDIVQGSSMLSSRQGQEETAARELMSYGLCKTCHESVVSVLFLPCRHLVTCDVCARVVTSCTQCQQEITGTMNVVLTKDDVTSDVQA